MLNKKIKKRSVGPVNLFGLGSEIKSGWKGASTSSKVSGIASGVGGAITALSGGTESKAGNIMTGVGNAVSAIPGIGGIVGTALSAIGGLTNAMFGTKWNDEFISQTESNISEQANQQVEASTTGEFQDVFSDASMLGRVKESQVGKDGWFTNKVANRTKKINSNINNANNRLLQSFHNRANNINTQNDLTIAANFADLGGYLFRDGGGIHIKKANRGKFTEYCGGKVTSACIQRGKHSNSPVVRKRATFAQNARGWHHAFGGELGTNGTDWTNGVNIFDVGGSHEENPNQGIPQGVDENGIPNLVEEGEVKFQDYIFSNRIKTDQNILDLVGLPKRYKGKKYSDIAEKVSKESEERPNDPISRLGLEDSMLKLQTAQELQRAKKQNNKFAKGGKLYSDGSKLDLSLLQNDMLDTYVGGLQSLTAPTTKSAPTWMRYAPAMGGALGALASSLTPVDAPDYGNADSIVRARQSVGYTPLTQKLTYNPFDKEFYLNKLRAQSGATRRSLANASGGNRATLMAGLIGADATAQNQMGDLFRQAEEYNQSQRERVADFNRGTDQANAQMGIQTGMFNSQSKMQAAESAARLREIEKQRYRSDKAAKRDAIAANLTNFIDSLGGIGQENFNRNSLQGLRDAGVLQAMIDSQGRIGRAQGGKIKRSTLKLKL